MTKWGSYRVGFQISEQAEVNWVRIPWLGIAILRFGRLAITFNWPVEFGAR